jgi:uncharacterized protein with HEPN domain
LSPRSRARRAADIADSISTIEGYIEGLDQASFSADSKTVDAVAMNLHSIGEAAKHMLRVDPLIRTQYPTVDWDMVTRLREHIAHEYFRIDVLEVWTTTQTVLSDLKAAVLVIK